MNTHKTKQIIQNFLSYLTQRNLAELSNLFSEKVDWYIPGDVQKAPWLGRRNTRKEIVAFYELLWQNTAPIGATIDHMLIEDNNAVITGSFSTTMLSTNKIVDSLFCIQITISDELITRYRLLEDSYAVSVALTS